MKVTINRQVTTEVEIDIELPYYFEQTYDGDEDYSSNTYGCIHEDHCDTIEAVSKDCDTVTSFKFERTVFREIATSGFSCYFEPKYKSSKKVYDEIRQIALEFLTKDLT